MNTIVCCPYCARSHDMELTHIGQNREMIYCLQCEKQFIGVILISAIDLTRPLSGDLTKGHVDESSK